MLAAQQTSKKDICVPVLKTKKMLRDTVKC